MMSLMKELKSYGWVQDSINKNQLSKEYPTKHTVIIGKKDGFPTGIDQKIPLLIRDQHQNIVDESFQVFNSIKDIEEYIENKIDYLP